MNKSSFTPPSSAHSNLNLGLSGQISNFKQDLKDAYDKVLALHEADTPIEIIIKSTAAGIDELLKKAWQMHFESDAQTSKDALCMVAVGGYGRQELNLHSDIDLLFLHAFKDDVAEASLSALGLDAFIQFLWDIGLEVGHSVRSLEDCLEQANLDITIMTNSLESRLFLGNTALYADFEGLIREKTKWSNADFFEEKRDEQTKRHERHDDTINKLEPNIKSSPGGLRDVQTIGWVANKIYGTSDLNQLRALDLLSQDELDRLTQSRNTLWTLRNALHRAAGRSEDRLLFLHQQSLAETFELKDNETQLAIEQLMQRYYLAAGEIRRINQLILQSIDEQLHFSDQAKRIEIDAHFYIKNGYLYLTEKDLFQSNPSLILLVFKHFQQHHLDLKGMSAECARSLREAQTLIDDSFRNKALHKQTFISIFKHEAGLTHTLRSMHEYGILGAFMPAFRNIEGQMQHDLFHAYTVDAHTLMVVRNLRRFMYAPDEQAQLSALMHDTPKRYRLYLGAIFHDIAKGRGGNHDKLGAKDAAVFGKTFGLSETDTDLIAWLVLNHLQMSKVSQREDLSDPEVISRFAQLVGTKERLDNLYLLTVADIQGTSTTTWTAWKGHLLAQLHRNTRYFLEQKQANDSTNEQDSADRIAQKQAEVSAKLPKSIAPNRLAQFWQMLDDEYYDSHDSQAITWHAELICSASALDLPAVDARYIPELEAEQYVIYTADSNVLLSTITGSIDHLNQNIVQALIHSANPGFSVLIFTVTSNQDAPDDADIAEHVQSLRHALLHSRDHKPVVKKLIPRRLQQFNIQASVEFIDTDDAQLTSMHITALDQPGLMHLIATSLANCHIRLISAHIATAGEKVKDHFMLCQPNNRKSLSDKQKEQLRNVLLDALA